MKMNLISTNHYKHSHKQLRLLDSSKQNLINTSILNSTKSIVELQQQLAVRKQFYKKHTVNENEHSSSKLKTYYNSIKQVTPIKQYSSNLNALYSSNNNMLESGLGKEYTLVRKKTNHSHKKARAFNENKEIGQMYLAEAIKQSESRTKEGQHKNQINKLNISIAIIAGLSILISFINCEINVNRSNKIINDSSKRNQMRNKDILELLKHRNLTFMENFLRIVQLIINVVNAVIILYQGYIEYQFHCKEYIDNLKYVLADKSSFFDQINYILKNKLLDVIIATIAYPPSFNTIYIKRDGDIYYPIFLEFIINLINLLKVKLIFHMFKGLTLWNSKIASSICRTYKVQPNIQFIIKSQLRTHPLIFLISFFCFYLLTATCIIRMFEFGAILDNHNFFEKDKTHLNKMINVMWMVGITSFTNGFGDCYPKTIIGRLLTFVFAVIGVVIVSMIIMIIISYFQMSQGEKKVYLKLKKIFNPENKEHKAANVIREILILRKLYKMKLMNQFSNQKVDYLMQLFIILSMMRKDTKSLRDKYKIARAFAISMDDLLQKMKKKIDDNTKFLNGHLDKLKGIEDKLQSISENQISTLLILKDVKTHQNNIMNYLIQWNNDNMKKNQKKKSEVFLEKKYKTINNTNILNSNISLSKNFSSPPPYRPRKKVTMCLINTKNLDKQTPVLRLRRKKKTNPQRNHKSNILSYLHMERPNLPIISKSNKDLKKSLNAKKSRHVAINQELNQEFEIEL